MGAHRCRFFFFDLLFFLFGLLRFLGLRVGITSVRGVAALVAPIVIVSAVFSTGFGPGLLLSFRDGFRFLGFLRLSASRIVRIVGGSHVRVVLQGHVALLAWLEVLVRFTVGIVVGIFGCATIINHNIESHVHG